jgi:hypothetical protein
MFALIGLILAAMLAVVLGLSRVNALLTHLSRPSPGGLCPGLITRGFFTLTRPIERPLQPRCRER